MVFKLEQKVGVGEKESWKLAKTWEMGTIQRLQSIMIIQRHWGPQTRQKDLRDPVRDAMIHWKEHNFESATPEFKFNSATALF